MDHYRVYGNPIKQSKSPFIHQSFANQTQQSIEYISELVPLDSFEITVKQFIAKGGKGANVTLPFKEQAMALCDQLTPRAALAGAVNTLSFKDGLILGDNTDGVGLVNDLKNHEVTLANKSILLLGAGGAAKGVVLPLLDEAPLSIVIANRTLNKAQALVEQSNDNRLSACGFEDMPTTAFDIIINATSASLSGQMPSINESVIGENTVCYDMVYGNSLTNFLQWAKSHHAKEVIDGLGMLVGQAAESFTIWRGVSPDTRSTLQQLRQQLK